MRLCPELVDALSTGHPFPVRRDVRFRRLRVQVEINRLEALKQPDDEERHLVVRELLPQADARPSVEGQEDEGVRGEILVQACVQEAIRVKLLGCEEDVQGRYDGQTRRSPYRQGPNNPFADACNERSRTRCRDRLGTGSASRA